MWAFGEAPALDKAERQAAAWVVKQEAKKVACLESQLKRCNAALERVMVREQKLAAVLERPRPPRLPTTPEKMARELRNSEARLDRAMARADAASVAVVEQKLKHALAELLSCQKQNVWFRALLRKHRIGLNGV